MASPGTSRSGGDDEPQKRALPKPSPAHEDDILSDSSLEELDLESLLGSDDSTSRRQDDDTPRGDEAGPELIDDGEIDLIEDDPVSAAASDLDEVAGGSERVELEESPGPAALRVASGATNGSQGGLGAAAHEPDVSMDAPARDHAGEPGKSREKRRKVAGTESAPAASTSHADGVGEERHVAKEKAKKVTTRVSKSKVKTTVERGAERAAAAVPATSARGSVAFVCSECYEEFLLPATYSQEMVCCPECLHVGKRPDADFLRTVNRHKSGERSAMAMAIGAGALAVALLAYWAWSVSDMAKAAADKGATDGGIATIVLGAAALVAIVFLWLTARAESNRWEVYF